jgi:hypothetical protein
MLMCNTKVEFGVQFHNKYSHDLALRWHLHHIFQYLKNVRKPLFLH